MKHEATRRYIDAWETAARNPGMFICSTCHAVAENEHEWPHCECVNPVMPVAVADRLRVAPSDVVDVVRRIDELRAGLDA